MVRSPQQLAVGTTSPPIPERGAPMYLVSRFRLVSGSQSPRSHLVSMPGPAVGHSPRVALPASPPAASAEPSRLQCVWEEAERSDVYLGGERFLSGNLLLHWMPVH